MNNIHVKSIIKNPRTVFAGSLAQLHYAEIQPRNRGIRRVGTSLWGKAEMKLGRTRGDVSIKLLSRGANEDRRRYFFESRTVNNTTGTADDMLVSISCGTGHGDGTGVRDCGLGYQYFSKTIRIRVRKMVPVFFPSLYHSSTEVGELPMYTLPESALRSA